MLNTFSSRFAWFKGTRHLLWGYLNERVYVNKPLTIQEHKTNIRAEIRWLWPETMNTAMENVVEGACICEQENEGCYFSHTIPKKKSFIFPNIIKKFKILVKDIFVLYYSVFQWPPCIIKLLNNKSLFWFQFHAQRR